MTYTTIETLHQIKYLQLFAINILLFILRFLPFYFMCLKVCLGQDHRLNGHWVMHRVSRPRVLPCARGWGYGS